jgi:hypothetical protein
MELRRVPIDWDDLELALTAHAGEWSSYLDVRTGEVRVRQTHALPGYRHDYELTEDEADSGLADGTLIAVEPLPSSVEYDWMAEFADTVPDNRLRQALQAALGRSRPFRRFKDALADYPRRREQWFAFRDARVREAMKEWLADNGIEPTTEPPTRPGRAGSDDPS